MPMITYSEAVSIILNEIRPLAPVVLPTREALGMVLAAPVASLWDLPREDYSAMDGFAFAFSPASMIPQYEEVMRSRVRGKMSRELVTVAPDSPLTRVLQELVRTRNKSLPVVGSIPAGTHFKGDVPPGSAVKIMTGAPVPEECDTVIPIEDVEEEGGYIRLQKTVKRGDHVRRRGEEIGKGQLMIEPGTLIGPWELGMLAAAGIAQVTVIPKPTVAVLSTGNELIELGQTPGPGQIINSNLYVLEACLQAEGCGVLSLGVARDDIESISRKVSEGLQADMIVSTGGVSAGDHDCVKDALQQYDFRLGFWKVRIKPGKPVLFGTIHEKPVFGLPGNPASASASFELFVLPALRRLAGFAEALQPRLSAMLTRDVRGNKERQRFLWGSLKEECGCYDFIPSSRQGSGQARSMHQAHALMSVPIGTLDVPAGSVVEVIPIRLPLRRKQ